MVKPSERLYAEAEAADAREVALRTGAVGHECGHQFIIEVTSLVHSGIAGQGPESHTDQAKQWTTGVVSHRTVVRASNLRDAMRRAGAKSLSDWELLQDGQPVTEDEEDDR